MVIQVDTVQIEGMNPIVVPRAHRIEAAAQVLKRQAEDLMQVYAATPDSEAREAIRKRAEDLRTLADRQVENYNSLRERMKDRIETTSYSYTPFSYGLKQRTRAKHTKFDSNGPRLDVEAYSDELAAASLGWTVDQLGDLPPTVAQHLRAEILEAGEPDPGKLDFLS